MRKLVAAALLGAALAAPGSVRAQLERTSLREYPTYDRQTAGLVQRLQDSERLERLYAEGPADPETIQLLLERERIDDALVALRTAITGPVAPLIRVLGSVAARFYVFQRDDARGYVAELAKILESVRARLPQLPREDAARVARELMALDNQLAHGGSAGWGPRLRAFINDYAGTDAALLAQVDLIGDRPGDIPREIAELEQFWRDHPNSIVGAKALYMAGFQWHVNIAITGVERRGSDPTPRFLKVLDIYRELQSGKYPPCEWVDKAPELVIGFFVSSEPAPAFEPGNLEKMIDGYRQFVFDRFEKSSDTTVDNSVGYVITSKLGGLYARQGRRVAGIEQTLTDLEARVNDKAAVRLFRADFYLRESTAGPADGRAAMAGNARATYTALADGSDSWVARKALASLAAMALATRDFAAARPLFQRFIETYPRAPWAWLAAMRIGLIDESENNWRAAADAYALAARTYTDAPFAAVFGAGFAARAHEAAGDFETALGEYRRALAAWRPDYGPALSIAPWQSGGPARPGASPPVDRTRLVKDEIASRIATLTRSASAPGGLIVERGRWQISQQAWRDAQTTLRGFLKSYPKSTLTAEARRLLHRAQLEQALDAVATDATAAGETAAVGQLDALIAEPADFFTAAAQLAKGAIRLRQSNPAEAATVTRAALMSLLAVQAPIDEAPLRDPVDADVAELRRIVFRPMGDFPLLAGAHWNAFTFPTTAPEFFVMQPDVVVRVAGQEPATRVVYQRFPDLKNVLFISADEQGLLARMVAAIGGNQRRAPTQVMETPNQPVGVSRDIVSFWDGFFPTRPGHWGGWELETYPQITRIEFFDAARTKASVMVTVGYSGATVVMEKIDGAWKAMRLTGQWIT
ncbi:MAG TPA: hypothetical protein VFV98_10145 [Vicinamibacterales bacterium]|nr:hypothetical protein [Vicinamibacterales bacterium]